MEGGAPSGALCVSIRSPSASICLANPAAGQQAQRRPKTDHPFGNRGPARSGIKSRFRRSRSYLLTALS
jgi:hypothetical protein